jgi:DNA end-binding protein Ku
MSPTKTKPKKKPAAKKKKAAPKKKAEATARPTVEGAHARRPAWQGSISFGLINVPVMLYNITISHRIAFHQLHDKDGARIKQERVCSADGEEVPYDHIVKGYEIEPDRYVIIEPEELKTLSPERSNAIELESFIDASEIDPLYYDASYFALPGKGAATSYALLREAMEAENKAAVARLVMHQKEHLVALWPRGDTLVVSALHFADEVTDPADLPGKSAPAKAAKPAEKKAARELVKALSGDFKINDYRDEYREQVLDLIEAKAKGKKIAQPKKSEDKKPVPDLMAALEQSLAGVAGKSRARSRGSKGTHKSRAKAH